MSGMFKNPLTGAIIAGKAIDHFVTSADARLNYKANSEMISYMENRDSSMVQQANRQLADAGYARSEARNFAAIQTQRNEDMIVKMGAHQWSMQQEALRNARAIETARNESMEAIARTNRDTRIHELEVNERIAEADRNALLKKTRYELESQERIARDNQQMSLKMQQRQHSHEEMLQDRQREMLREQHSHEETLQQKQLQVSEDIAKRHDELARYLNERNIESRKEIVRFSLLANRETQIMLAREQARNMLQDRIIQGALNDFPLDISPLVLLGNKSDLLTGLLRFSNGNQTDIAQVYNEVNRYAANPEPINIFITPMRLDSNIKNREALSSQIWDKIYRDIESYFTEHYNRNSRRPVIAYPSAWKSESVVGLHACETVHFFLKNIPCFILEPKFDGTSFRMMVSAWQLGYTTTEHVRTEMKFEINLDEEIIKAVYARSISALKLLEKLGQVNDSMKEDLQENITRYNTICPDGKIDTQILNEISALGLYNVFHVVPDQDLQAIAKLLSDIICVNLSVLIDSHHLLATDAEPIFPTLFKSHFHHLYESEEIRAIVYNCYERILICLRNQDNGLLPPTMRRQIERTREMQMLNIRKQLELVNETEIQESIEDKVKKYVKAKHGVFSDDMSIVWFHFIDRMTLDDEDFIYELLPNIKDRATYKKIDRKLSVLKHHN